MAQLSQDCFASGAQILSVEDAVAAIVARFSRRRRRGNRRARRRRWPRARATTSSRRCSCRRSRTRPSTATPCAARTCRAERARELFRVAGRLQAGARGRRAAASRPAKRFASSPARRCPKARTRCSCRRTSRLDDAGRALLPPGLKRGANVRPAGEDIALGRVIVPANRWLRPQDVAVAAAMGLTEIRVRRRVKIAVFSNGDEIVEPGTRAARHAALRLQPHHVDRDAAAHRLRRQRPRHSPRRQRADRGGAEGRRSVARPDLELGRRLDGRGRLRQGRRGKRRDAGVLAHRDEAGAARGDGRHRRHAVHRPARQPRRELRDVRAGRAARDPRARRRAVVAAARRSRAGAVLRIARSPRAASTCASTCARPRTARSRP